MELLKAKQSYVAEKFFCVYLVLATRWFIIVSPEDGSSVFLRNDHIDLQVRMALQHRSTALQPKRSISCKINLHDSKNTKSHKMQRSLKSVMSVEYMDGQQKRAGIGCFRMKQCSSL